MLGPILSLLGGLISPITEVVKGKQAIKKAVTESKIKRIEAKEMTDIELDKLSRENSGWMDDISFYLFLMPMVLAFYPPALPHIQAGFIALVSMPQWYQYGLGMMLISVWGYRKLVSPIVEAVAKAWLGRF